MAIYVECQNCGFVQDRVYDMDITSEGFVITPNSKKFYKYCPNCGLKMHLFDGKRVCRVGYDD